MQTLGKKWKIKITYIYVLANNLKAFDDKNKKDF